MEKLKMFVWQNVLTDYTDGMIVVLAPDLPTAIQVAEKQCIKSMGYIMDSFKKAMSKKPTIVTKPSCFFVYGGG